MAAIDKSVVNGMVAPLRYSVGYTSPVPSKKVFCFSKSKEYVLEALLV